MKFCLPLIVAVSLLLSAACGNDHQAGASKAKDTTTTIPSAANSGMPVDDTLRRSDASRKASDTASDKPIGTMEEKTKNLK